MFLASSFLFASAYFNLPFFNFRFRRAINIFGKEATRKMVIGFFAIGIMVLFFIRNF